MTSDPLEPIAPIAPIAPRPPGSRRPGGARAAVRALLVAAATATAALLGFVPGGPVAAAPAIPAGTHVVDGDTVAVVRHLSATSFASPGPLGVGETTLTLPTDGAPVEVWYPATKASVAGQPVASYDVSTWLPPALKKLIPAGFSVTYPSGGVTGVAVAPGRYPLVVFSHGYAGFRDQSTFLTAFLASWGFVVAAPDHFSRDLTEVLGGPTGATAKTTDVGDLKATIALMSHENATASSPFHGHVDATLVGAVGHSSGGAAVEALAASDPKVTTFIGLAGATVGSIGQATHGAGAAAEVPNQPGMLMSGTADTVVPDSGMIAAYGHLRAPKRLVLLKGAGHLVFADICEIGSGQGGLLAIAQALKVPIPASLKPLATDGCTAPDLPPPQGWPAIRQAVTAQLRHVFGFDTSDAGLNGLVAAYPNAVAADRAKS
ncbi:MAG TPA: dienelactone hydrolase family protein [Acidimicrobiales bacterium]|jgi:predicted dienelactone hydrolase|nr:dienelactone hydrolase family protein [Acidimicrobiales bacterium]